MGIALLTIADLFTPLQSLAHRWMPVRRRHDDLSGGLRYVAVRPSCARPGADAQAAAQPARPLRVVRVVDTPRCAAPAGGLVISGRMADVCAELDRLAALEAAAVARPGAATTLH